VLVEKIGFGIAALRGLSVSATYVPKSISDENRNAEETGQVSKGADCEIVNLLAFVEEENRELRRAVIGLALDTLLLREAMRSNKR
jgi:hypothetical protein